jgi:hypothetical protein
MGVVRAAMVAPPVDAATRPRTPGEHTAMFAVAIAKQDVVYRLRCHGAVG